MPQGPKYLHPSPKKSALWCKISSISALREYNPLSPPTMVYKATEGHDKVSHERCQQRWRHKKLQNDRGRTEGYKATEGYEETERQSLQNDRGRTEGYEATEGCDDDKFCESCSFSWVVHIWYGLKNVWKSD